MSEFPGKGPAITAACCYKETMWAVLGLHTHTHTHPGTSHIHTHECHRHATCTQVLITHKHVTRMSHTYVCHRVTRVHTHVPQHVSTSTMIHTPFTSCLSGLFAHIGMLTSVNDGSIAINQCHKKHLAKSLPSYPLVSMPIERSGCSDGCVTSKASIPLDLVPHGVGTLSPVKPSFHPFLCLSLSGSGDLPFCFLSL